MYGSTKAGQKYRETRLKDPNKNWYYNKDGKMAIVMPS